MVPGKYVHVSNKEILLCKKSMTTTGEGKGVVMLLQMYFTACANEVVQ